MTDAKKSEETGRWQVLNSIANGLKGYPFLLIALAGLVVLATVFSFSTEKLREFKWVFCLVILVPLLLQAALEFMKQTKRDRRGRPEPLPARAGEPNTVPTNAPPAPAALPASAVRYSRKVLWGLGLLLFCLLGFATMPASDIRSDHDTMLGFLAVSVTAAVLGLLGWLDARQGKAHGKNLAMMVIVVGALLALVVIGWMQPSGPGY